MRIRHQYTLYNALLFLWLNTFVKEAFKVSYETMRADAVLQVRSDLHKYGPLGLDLLFHADPDSGN